VGLKGSLDELPLTDLVEMTSLGDKTGRLLILDEEGVVAGELAFRDGRLVGATCGALTAEKAFYALLEVQHGTFDFDPDAELDDDSCNLPTTSLLMEGMRRLDELEQLRRTLPAPAVARLLEGEAGDPLEALVLAYLGPGARTVGDIVDGALVGGEVDEYDVLKAMTRLTKGGVVRVEIPHDDAGRPLGQGGPPQPELER
jgi:hypothetical protein